MILAHLGEQDVTFAVATVNGKETGRLPVFNTVTVPAREFMLRVGAKPGTDVPPVRNEAAGSLSQHANREIIVLTTPEMDFWLCG
jgi:uncharacterized protein YabE (DUF348 family)